MKTTISIIMPFKDGNPYLASCIDSILDQRLSDWELIIVDDHSGFDSASQLNQIVNRDNRIKVLKNPGNGIIPALDRGLKESNGTYITRMDCDDLMPPERLSKMKSLLAGSTGKTVVTGLVSYFSNAVITEGYQRYERWLNEINLQGCQWENVYRECVIASPNWMVRKEELLAIGGFGGLRYPEDYHLVHRWYQNSFAIKCVPEVTLNWRDHGDRTSKNSENYSQKAFFDLKLEEFVRYDKNEGPLVLWGTGVKGKLVARYLDETGTPFTWMNMIEGPEQIGKHQVLPYLALKNYLPAQLLIAVYPGKNDRRNIDQHLERLNMKIGRGYWYL